MPEKFKVSPKSNRDYLLERLSLGLAPRVAFAVEDGRLISGQNPASSGVVAELLLKAQEKNA